MTLVSMWLKTKLIIWHPENRMSQFPLVSIITPSYNHGHFLQQTIRSVITQDYPNLEYLIVDGGSTDNTLDIIQQYASHLAWWVSEPDQGQADAINKGFTHARGEIIAWLNSDDLYFRPDAVSHAVQALQAHPHVGMVYGDGLLVDEELNLLDWHSYPQFTLTDLLSFKVLLQPAVFMRQNALCEAGYLPVQYDLILDHALWVLIAARYPILHVSEYWAVERTHAHAKTISKAAHYGEEAFPFVRSLEGDPYAGPVINRDSNEIYAGLHVFDAKRQIDAGQPRQALSRFRQAWRLSPKVVLNAWYKVVQAIGGAMGLSDLFLIYRNLRRQMKYHHQRLNLDENGVHLVNI
jgi:glycosyltransferase involved in cell wall biosynthesis